MSSSDFRERVMDRTDSLTYTALSGVMAQSAGYRVRFGLTDRLPTSDNFYAVLIKS